MKSRIFTLAVAMLAFLVRPGSVLALDGEPYIHDPSTIIMSDGKFYTYGTGGLPTLMSDDGWTWRSAGSALQALPGGPGPEVRSLGGGNSWAPDIIKLGDRYAVIFSPYDISCALENRESLECEGYTRKDAARIGLNVLLYSLHQ